MRNAGSTEDSAAEATGSPDVRDAGSTGDSAVETLESPVVRDAGSTEDSAPEAADSTQAAMRNLRRPCNAQPFL